MDKRTKEKIRITKEIISAAKVYKNQLVGKCFLYVFDDRCIEIIYRRRDFLHLTGVDTKLTPLAFYKDAVRGNLRHNQFSFSTRHPYDFCVRKVSVLKEIGCVTNSELVIFEDISTSTYFYKFGLSEFNFTLCLTQDVGTDGKTISDKFVTRSLRVEDSSGKSKDFYEVKCIFSKENTERCYAKLEYIDKNYSLECLPDDVLEKVSIQL